MLNALLVALAVFICVGGAELIGFTMLNRPIVIGPLVGLFFRRPPYRGCYRSLP